MEYSPTGAKAAQDYISETYDLTKAPVAVGDFFEFKDPGFDIIYDYTFLCAISVDSRENWGKVNHFLSFPFLFTIFLFSIFSFLTFHLFENK